MTRYDPEQWLETSMRILKEYAREEFNRAVKDDDLNDIGDEIYEIIMEFPESEDILKLMPMAKTIVHFEIDEIDNDILGFGEGHHALNYDSFLRLIEPQEAGVHLIDLDVGIWASTRSGGLTARLRAYQILRMLFHGPLANQELFSRSQGFDDKGKSEGGLEITEFTGGRFIQDRINDVPIFRMIDCTLKIRVFSRSPIFTQIPTIEDITIIPELIIDDNLQLPMGAIWKDEGTSFENATVGISAGDTGSGG
jgi:hypothetical protein